MKGRYRRPRARTLPPPAARRLRHMKLVDASTIALAHRLADEAGVVIRPYFRRRIDVVDKGALAGRAAFDPVTEADRRAEEVIRAIIERERPEDGILGEEYGEKAGTSGRRWVLDPIDGTRAFITGRHEWGSLIALEEDARPTLGIIDQPVLGERFCGVDGMAFLRAGGADSPMRVRPCARIEDAVLCATHPSEHFERDERAAFGRVADAVRMTRFGGDCYIFAALALGFVDLVVESGLRRWDVAALIPVVEGAGGIMTSWSGRPCNEGGRVLAASDERVHAAALKLLGG
jgi:myo-inositol-1(or 4)-monophosphatase